VKKYLTTLLTVALALIVTTAWADIDPRDNFGTCGFTSTVETYEPDAGGTLMKRVTYVSECDTPMAGEETITITTEEYDGMSLNVTEVREAVRTEVGGVYYTTTEIYDGSMALQGKVEHTYDLYVSDPDLWFQEWTYYTWNGMSYDIEGYTTRTTEQLGGDMSEINFVYYDTTYRADPVLPMSLTSLTGSSSPVLPPLNKAGDSEALESLGRMYDRVRNAFIVNRNSQQEGIKMLAASGLPSSHGLVPPPGVYVAAILHGERVNDAPSTTPFNGFWTTWTRYNNDVDGNLTVLFGWTSDRDLNEPTDDWWQARVKQSAAGTLEFIENAHRSGLTEEDHYDTYTVLNSMYMIDSQTVKVFDWDELNPGNFTETTTKTDAMGSTVSYSEWTVVFD